MSMESGLFLAALRDENFSGLRRAWAKEIGLDSACGSAFLGSHDGSQSEQQCYDYEFELFHNLPSQKTSYFFV